MAWSSRGAYNTSNHMMSSASMGSLLMMNDQVLDLSTQVQLKEYSTLHQCFPPPILTSTARILRSNDYSNEEVEMHMDESESTRIRKKRRLTGEQLCALEDSFEADKKLEAQRKQELAKRLGLEPRQVAVWFQNRRARSKTKHLEHDFALLKSKYHYMLAETHKLRSEVSRLTAELEASKSEAGGVAKAGAAPGEVQLAPIGSSQASGSNQFSTTCKSNNIMDLDAPIIHEGSSNLPLTKLCEGSYILISAMQQDMSTNSASPSMSCSPETSPNGIISEGKSTDYNTNPGCNISEGDQQHYMEQAHCSEVPACFKDAIASTYRFECGDSTSHSSLGHLRKVNDIHIVQAGHHLNYLPGGDDHLLPLTSHYHHVPLDCLWGLTT